MPRLSVPKDSKNLYKYFAFIAQNVDNIAQYYGVQRPAGSEFVPLYVWLAVMLARFSASVKVGSPYACQTA